MIDYSDKLKISSGNDDRKRIFFVGMPDNNKYNPSNSTSIEIMETLIIIWIIYGLAVIGAFFL